MNWNPDIGIPLAVAGLLVLIAVAVFGRPKKPKQGRRVETETPWLKGAPRREPGLNGSDENNDVISFGNLSSFGAEDPDVQVELSSLDRSLGTAPSPNATSEESATPDSTAGDSELGRRGDTPPQHIVTLMVVSRTDEPLDGASIVIAAEKAGLVYGHMGIFHRLVDGHRQAEPVFSVANVLKPGHFDLRNVHDIETPGLAFFMTLPGPISALDAWETMLPTAERMAELLDAQVLDEHHNTLGRQRIAHIRDEMRQFDREQEKEAQRRW